MPEATYGSRSDGEGTRRRDHPGLDRRTDDERDAVDAETLLSALSDEYARTVLAAVAEEALPARALAERLEMSRATVYRRLNTLEEAGLVESTMSVHPEGNHRKRFRATLDGVELSFDGGDVAVECLT